MGTFLHAKATRSFPSQSKAARDITSNLNVLYQILAEPLEAVRSNEISLHRDAFLFKNWLETATVYQVRIPTDEAPDNSRGVITYPVVTAQEGEYVFTRVNTVEELLKSHARALRDSNLFQLEEGALYDHEPLGIWSEEPPDNFEPTMISVDHVFESPMNLWVNVLGGEVPLKNREPLAPGNPWVKIVGYNESWISVEEIIPLRSFEAIQSKHAYAEIVSIEHSECGYLNFSVGPRPNNTVPKRHPFLTVHGENKSSPLYLHIENTEDGALTLYYFLKTANDFVNLDSYLDAYEEIARQRIETEGSLALQDYFVHPETGHLYVSAAEELLFIIEPTLPEVQSLNLRESISYLSSLTAIMDEQYVCPGDTVRGKTKLVNTAAPINKVIISLIDPSLQVYYLQSDLSWDTTLYAFEYDRVTADAWQDIHFDVTAESEGQWEVYVEAFTDRYITLSGTAIVASRTTDVEVLSVLSHSGMVLIDGNEIALIDGTDVTAYEPLKLACLFDTDNNSIYVADEFDTIEVAHE
jgi:hypothetical protein